MLMAYNMMNDMRSTIESRVCHPVGVPLCSGQLAGDPCFALHRLPVVSSALRAWSQLMIAQKKRINL